MSLIGYDVRNPYWDLEILRAPPDLTKEVLTKSIVRLRYVDQKGKGNFPKFEIELDNTSGKLWNAAMLAIGLRLKVRFGYPGAMCRPFLAMVTRVWATTFPGTGKVASPRPDPYGLVRMEAKAHGWRLEKSIEKKLWAGATGLPLSRALRQIALAYGYVDNQLHIQDGVSLLDFKLGNEPLFDAVQMRDDETPAEFFERKANERGYVFRWTSKEIHWHQRAWKGIPAEIIGYYMGPDVLNFSIEGDYSLAPQSVTGKSVDPLKGHAVSAVLEDVLPINFLAVNLPVGGKKLPDSMFRKDIVTAPSGKLLEATVRRATAHRERKWRIKMTVVGNPFIFPPDPVVLHNFGQPVDGLWFVDEVEHLFDTSGYTTTIGLRGKRGPGGQCAIKHSTIVNERGEPINFLAWIGTGCGTRKEFGKGKKGKKKGKQDRTLLRKKRIMTRAS